MAQDWTGNDQLRDKFDKLEALNAEMLEALKLVSNNLTIGDRFPELHDMVQAAIARAEAQP